MLRSIRNYLTETAFPPSTLVGLLVLVVLLSVFGASASKMSGSSGERARQIAEDAVRRAAVTCCAVEGCDPADGFDPALGERILTANSLHIEAEDNLLRFSVGGGAQAAVYTAVPPEVSGK